MSVTALRSGARRDIAEALDHAALETAVHGPRGPATQCATLEFDEHGLTIAL